MGNKYSNAQAAATPGAMSEGIRSAFGDGPEADARKRKMAEDAAAQAQAQQVQGDTPSVWGAMGMDAVSGVKSMGQDAWTAISKKKK
jgi:hypothetical protein